MQNRSSSVLSGLIMFACLAAMPNAAVKAAMVQEDVTIPHNMSLCEKPAPAQAYVKVAVEGLKTLEGNIRVQVYGPGEDEFLEKGMKLVRIDVKTEKEGQEICVPMPGVGDFTLVVMHDRNANGKADFFSEGFGFSNNPKLGLGKPDADDVVFSSKEGVTKMPVRLKYIFGADEEQTKKRRQLRRR